MSDPTAPPVTPNASQSGLTERKKSFNEFQAQSRLRFESLVKLLLLIDGGALTLSIGAVLNNADSIPSIAIGKLQWSWALLFFSISASIVAMVGMIVATFHMGVQMFRTLDVESHKIQMIRTWNPLRIWNALVGIASALSCILGLGLLAMVAHSVANNLDAGPAVYQLSSTGSEAIVIESPWWSSVPGVFLGVLLGFFIAEIREWMTKRRLKSQNFEALTAEIRICGAIARGFMNDTVQSPAYRLPTLAYEKSFPAILTYKEVTADDRDALIRYYNNVNALNRCLDHCNEARVEQRKNPDLAGWLDREWGRARLKAEKIRAEEGAQYIAAVDVLAKHVPKESLGPIALNMQEAE